MIIAIAGTAAALLWMLQSPHPEPRAGARYVRSGLDPAAVAVRGGNAASMLVRDLLSRELPIQLDQVAHCDSIVARHRPQNAAHMVTLYTGVPTRCFSYTIGYTMLHRAPGHRPHAVPLRFTLVHAIDDFNRFFHD